MSDQLTLVPARPRRLVYLGTPDVAVPPLRALVDAGFDIPLVVSRADKRRGRGGRLTPSPVKAAAIDLGLAVSDDLGATSEVGADAGIVVAYGRIIPTDLLAKVPMLNLHFSLLPRWRGAAPVERAILAGDDITGVCLMAVAPELDTGDLYRCDEVTVGDDETLDELRGRLVDLGAKMLVEELTAGLGSPRSQEGAVTYAAKIDPDEHHLDFARPAIELHRVVRLGRAWTTIGGRRLKVLAARPVDEPVGRADPGLLDGARVATGDGWLALETVQPEGKRAMAATDWRNGAQLAPGTHLG